MSTINMSAVHCAGAIANLEGFRGIALPQQDQAQPTLTQLERRARKLEAMTQITSPPPVSEITWESLIWRICRMRSRRSPQLRPINHPSDFYVLFTSTVSGDLDVSIEKLRDIVFAIPSRGPKPPWLQNKITDEDEASCLIFQQLCHLRGQHSDTYMINSLSRSDLYIAATSTSFDVEQRPPPPPPPPFPMAAMPPQLHMPSVIPPPRIVVPEPAPMGNPMGNGPGCCACKCHSRTNSLYSYGSYLGKTKKPIQQSKTQNLGWLKRLLCFKSSRSNRQDYDDDFSSFTASVRDS